MRNKSPAELDYVHLDRLRKDHKTRTPIDDLVTYGISCAFIGTLAATTTGSVAYLITGDPYYVSEGAASGGIIGGVLGAGSAEHLGRVYHQKILDELEVLKEIIEKEKK